MIPTTAGTSSGVWSRGSTSTCGEAEGGGGSLRYNFEWDPAKARTNLRKHRVGFDLAAEIFLDPLAVSIADDEHSEFEQRWVTLGSDRSGSILVLVHTFSEISTEEC